MSAYTDRRVVVRRSAAVLVVALLVGLTVCAVGLALEHRRAVAEVERDRAIVTAAQNAILDLISPSYREPRADTDRIVASATGPWLAEFEATRDRFVGAVADSRTEAEGEILAAGVERRDPDGSTVVLVTAISKVTNAAGVVDDPRTWRLRVHVVETDAGYKLSKVEVVA